METDKILIAKAMTSVLMAAYEEGEIEPDNNGDLLPRSLYDFHVDDIVGFSTHYKRRGDGVYFHLKDGRAFDNYGDEIENASSEDFNSVEN